MTPAAPPRIAEDRIARKRRSHEDNFAAGRVDEPTPPEFCIEPGGIKPDNRCSTSRNPRLARNVCHEGGSYCIPHLAELMLPLSRRKVFRSPTGSGLSQLSSGSLRVSFRFCLSLLAPLRWMRSCSMCQAIRATGGTSLPACPFFCPSLYFGSAFKHCWAAKLKAVSYTHLDVYKRQE